MASSLGHGRELDTTGYLWTWDDLPPVDDGPMDRRRLRAWFAFGDPADPHNAAEDRPVELEIGSGKGTFLVSYGAAHPELDVLGIEYARAFCRYAADRARRHAMPNIRLLYAEASSFLKLYVAPRTLRQAHIYFPDPWPKKRHHKRRFVCEANLRMLHGLLVDRGVNGDGDGDGGDDAEAGSIRIATDHADYFAWMEEAAAAVSDVFERRDFEPPGSGRAGELVGTNFERKYRREGRSFYGMILVKH